LIIFYFSTIAKKTNNKNTKTKKKHTHLNLCVRYTKHLGKTRIIAVEIYFPRWIKNYYEENIEFQQTNKKQISRILNLTKGTFFGYCASKFQCNNTSSLLPG